MDTLAVPQVAALVTHDPGYLLASAWLLVVAVGIASLPATFAWFATHRRGARR